MAVFSYQGIDENNDSRSGLLEQLMPRDAAELMYDLHWKWASIRDQDGAEVAGVRLNIVRRRREAWCEA